MKEVYLEEMWSKTAFSRTLFCPNCGSHCYAIHHQLMPYTSYSWWVECEECHTEGESAPNKHNAIELWKHG